MEENRTMTSQERAALANAREAEAQRRKYASQSMQRQPQPAQSVNRTQIPQRQNKSAVQIPSQARSNTQEYPKANQRPAASKTPRAMGAVQNRVEEKSDTGEFPSYVRTGKGGYHPPKTPKRVVAKQHRRKLDPKFKAAIAAVCTVFAIIIIMLIAGFRYNTYKLPETKGEIRFFGIVRGGVPTSGWISSSDGTKGRLKKGSIKYSDGSLYEGGIVNAMRSGEGTLTLSNGDVYKGNFSENELNGKGTIVYAKGNTYEGSFVNGKKDGYGILKYKTENGFDVYEGEFANDKRNGSGIMTYSTGDVYTGEFKDDLKHGEGVYTHKSGRTFEGTYENNLRKEGRFEFENGAVFVGTFESNSTNQMLEGTYTYANGSSVTGRYDKSTNSFIAN